MVQDNYFLPDVPRNLAAKRPNIPVIYGNCRDEWAGFGKDIMSKLKNYIARNLEFSFIQDGLLNFTDFNRGSFEFMFKLIANYLTTREVDVQTILERVHLPLGSSDDDNSAWFRTQSDVSSNT